MNIKDIYRRLLIKWQSLPDVISSLKDSYLINSLRILFKIINMTIAIISVIFKALVLIAFVSLTIVWVFDLILLMKGQYPGFFTEEENSIFLVLGVFIELIGIAIISTIYAGKLQKTQKIISDYTKSTALYKLIDESVYKLSKVCVDTFIFPNIDFFEPGLIGQHSSNFPETVIYQDNTFRNERQIRKIQGKYNQYLGIVPMLVGIGLSVFMCICGILISATGQFLKIEVVSWIGSILGNLSLFVIYLYFFTALLIIMLLNHPKSLMYGRLQILQNEIIQLQKEEWAQKSIANLKNDSEKLIENYSNRLTGIRSTLQQEAMKVNELQRKALVTKENIEAMENFTTTQPEAALLMFKEQERRQEKREKKKIFRDFLIGFLSGVATTLFLKFFEL